MQVILLERVEKLGQMGDEVKVKDGFARNFLLPKKKALRATKANREFFHTQKSQLEAQNLKQKAEAEKVGKKLEGQTFALLRQAGDRGQLYGSVSPRDIADVITAGGFTVSRTQVPLDKAIKTIGLFPLVVVLHPEVRVTVTINVARTEEEAERQAKGEDVLADRTAEEEASAEAKVAAEELFEEGAGPKTDEGEEAEV
ncbi:MAG TPA: 50S ribosomal protein L9 [Rhizomicrobium sp.]|nr:50S ribosomal protein L9 [Rhizomicrobium sp.]